MARDDQQGSTATTDTPREQKLGTFVVLARIKGGDTKWEEIPSRYQAVTGEQAKKAAAQGIYASGSGELYDAIQEGGSGVEIQAVSERMWHSVTIKVEPQKPKLHIG